MPRLALTRKVGERIRIGDDVYVEVVGVERGRVKLVVVAPPEVEIWRTEIDPRTREHAHRPPAARPKPTPPPPEPTPSYGRMLLSELDDTE